MDSSEQVALYAAAFGGVCAVICTVLPAPSKKSCKAYVVFYKIINWCGANIGRARNCK